MGRRAAVLGCGLDLWEIIRVVRHNDGFAADAAAYLELDPALTAVAARYFGSNRVEIDDRITRLQETAEHEEAKWQGARDAIL